ncbi:hypothetical protein KL930_001285 [Ogataea haglerorum]|uniref:Cytidyltransferase-like domain-containing protein n=1 Tax=Ogataea haglerorum TaxID=1937702 RepID=A0ABQ7RG34_9ASCO|nr:hypothetical protein KL915_003195 [Ogataea haglerorum]KAG7698507.1 hypothetical protein KL951_001771 [Ogataea haglerorum]KAG7706287.1 hypothetical protein KL914_003182 [Ogataea haglerorum]KAG7728892.1 hypothetical protein KL948_003929 [Ogataea haglerorum]KAG7737958.1 hypothetical protein KL923_003505 [Ogataea haglerorum]
MFDFESHLNSFLKTTSKSFKLLFVTNNQFVLPITNRILVLDSSFNPPHKGHLSLVAKSLTHKLGDESAAHSSMNSRSVLLLLSIKNADKPPQPAKFEDRLKMMYHLAHEITDQLGVSCAIGITNCSLFVDKALTLEGYFKKNYTDRLSYTFLLGYDTLVRLLSPKYYEPRSLQDALGSFFNTSDCFVLTRNDGHDSLESQLQYLERMKKGMVADTPPTWADKIFLARGDAATENISSSSIREIIQSGSNSWISKTTPSVASFITEQRPYDDIRTPP